MLHGAANPSKSYIAGLPAIAKERELKNVFQRQKLVLRIITELWLVKVFRDVSDSYPYSLPNFAKVKPASGIIDPPPLMALKEVLSSDLVNFNPVTVVFMLNKYYGKALFGNPDGTAEGDYNFLVLAQIRIRFRRILSSYASSFDKRVRYLSRELLTMQRLNEKRLLKFGALREEYETAYDKLMEEATLLYANCQQLYKVLDLKMSVIVLRRESDLDGDLSSAIVEGEVWNDENEKMFYEDLVKLAPAPDIADDVSDVSDEDEEENLLKSLETLNTEILPNPQVSSSNSKSKALDSSSTKEEDFVHMKNPKFTSKEYTGDVEIVATAQEEAEEILQTLSRNPDKEVADQCAYRFKEVNNKQTRATILDFFTHVSPKEHYKLRYYCRFLASIDPIAPGIIEGVLDYLVDFFKYLRKKKFSGLYVSRMFVTRYLSELVKFGLVPKQTIFHTFHSLLTWVDKQNTEMLCSFLEGCGKYLRFNPSTAKLMAKYMDFIEETRASSKLGIDEKLLISYALHYVRPPPPLNSISVKERPIIERYISKLIYLDLSPETKDVVLEKIYKLDWNDQETFHSLRKMFCKIWKVKQENICVMADLLQDIKKYYYSFSVMVTDSILEDIRRGLELAGFRNNQMRLSQVIFLGELCKRRIVDHSVVMSTLYTILTFGYYGNMPIPEGCPLDPNTELFRIRLACTLLDTCGPFLNFVDSHLPQRGIAREIDLYMAFLQFYVRLKRNVSMDIEFQLRDTFKKVRPSFPLYETVEGASKGLEYIMSGKPPPPEEQKGMKVIHNANNNTSQVNGHKDTEGGEINGESKNSNKKAKGGAIYYEDLGRDAEFTMPKWERSEEEERERQRIYEEKKRQRQERADAQAEVDLEDELQQLMLERVDATSSSTTSVNNSNSSSSSSSSSINKRIGTSGIKGLVKKPFDAPIPDTSALQLEPGKPGSGYVPPKKQGHVKYAILLKNTSTKGGNNQSNSSSGGDGLDNNNNGGPTRSINVGNSTTIKTMELPKTSKFVESLTTEREEREKEKQRIKNIIMKYQYMDEEDTVDGGLKPLNQTFLAPTRYQHSNRKQI